MSYPNHVTLLLSPHPCRSCAQRGPQKPGLDAYLLKGVISQTRYKWVKRENAGRVNTQPQEVEGGLVCLPVSSSPSILRAGHPQGCPAYAFSQ